MQETPSYRALFLTPPRLRIARGNCPSKGVSEGCGKCSGGGSPPLPAPRHIMEFKLASGLVEHADHGVLDLTRLGILLDAVALDEFDKLAEHPLGLGPQVDLHAFGPPRNGRLCCRSSPWLDEVQHLLTSCRSWTRFTRCDLRPHHRRYLTGNHLGPRRLFRGL